MEGTGSPGVVVISLEDKEMNKIKKELEMLKSWGFETVCIDKVLEMIEQADVIEVKSDEKSVINIFYPPYVKEEGGEKYFREIPMYINTNRSYPLYQDVYCTGTGVPESDVWIT